MTQPKLTYFLDALCGWCYGFSPIITRIHREYKNEINFDVVSCALFLSNWEGMLEESGSVLELNYVHPELGMSSFQVGLIKPAGNANDVAPHILAGGHQKLAAATGMKIGEPFLDAVRKNRMTLNSLYPAMAIRIVKEIHPHTAIEAAQALMHAIYQEGLNSADVPAYASYAAKMGIDQQEFIDKMNDPAYKAKAMDEFKRYRSSQVHGFPSLLLEKDGEERVVVNGFGPRSMTETVDPADRFPTAKAADTIIARLDAMLRD